MLLGSSQVVVFPLEAGRKGGSFSLLSKITYHIVHSLDFSVESGMTLDFLSPCLYLLCVVNAGSTITSGLCGPGAQIWCF